jgi:ubiquinone biosynthesis protein UbiJ
MIVEQPAVSALNHLLKGQGWARERLRPFAGKRVQFKLAPLPDLRLRILDSGLVEADAQAASADASADLTVTVQPGAVPHLLARDEAAMAQVDLAGPVDLASTVQLLFRELAWDAEEDLSKIFGDVLAHRIAGAARDVLAWQKEAASRLAQNFAEYLTQEQPLLAPRTDVTAFRRSLETLNEDCTRLERRLEQLEARTRRPRS